MLKQDSPAEIERLKVVLKHCKDLINDYLMIIERDVTGDPLGAHALVDTIEIVMGSGYVEQFAAVLRDCRDYINRHDDPDGLYPLPNDVIPNLSMSLTTEIDHVLSEAS
jgi:hypothetical protein